MKKLLPLLFLIIVFLIFACTPDPDITQTFTVTFDSNGGSFVENITNLQTGSIISESPTPTRTDYQFAGWYKDSSKTVKWDFNKDSVTSDITLYAGWVIVYVGGFEVDSTGNDIAKYWENDQETILSSSTSYAAYVSSIILLDNKIYCAVKKDNFVTFWENDTEHVLTDGNNSSHTNTMAISGTDIYITEAEHNGFNYVAEY